ncbi:MAG: L-serine ammonia-lyase, iron-sulfur-dependent subunit beta [Defluviitaleaceae bacterium]|nr:L-serine ammonia-lyase, iron-sulfur-dependent subunit beta [Defluviitaleaceae bacterium]
MQIFDILGPIMIGPSSSHTAGVVRIGNVARRLLGHTPSHARIQFHGSLAKTYKGHGSDKAIVAGLLGFKPDDMRIRDSLKLAETSGLSYTIEEIDLENAHPNTIVLSLSCNETQGNFTLQAASVGGGNILVEKINEIDVLFDGYYDTMIIIHQDMPGAISLVTNVLAVEKINIAGMKVYRAKKGGRAIMVIEVDGRIDKRIRTTLTNLPLIEQVTMIGGCRHD